MTAPRRARRAKALPETERLRALAEAVRATCVKAAVDGYEDAAVSGLCHDGAFEAAVSAMRRVDLERVLRGGTREKATRGKARGSH